MQLEARLGLVAPPPFAQSERCYDEDRHGRNDDKGPEDEAMPALTRKEVEEIALLARLHLEPEEIDRMQGELGAILEHFVALAAVDTAGVPALTHAVPMDLRLRPDVVEASLPPEVALAGAPKRDGELLVVPSSIATPQRSGGGPAS